MIPQVLASADRDDFVWTVSDHSGERCEDPLAATGFESRIHGKGTRRHPLSEKAKEVEQGLIESAGKD